MRRSRSHNSRCVGPPLTYQSRHVLVQPPRQQIEGEILWYEYVWSSSQLSLGGKLTGRSQLWEDERWLEWSGWTDTHTGTILHLALLTQKRLDAEGRRVWSMFEDHVTLLQHVAISCRSDVLALTVSVSLPFPPLSSQPTGPLSHCLSLGGPRHCSMLSLPIGSSRALL